MRTLISNIVTRQSSDHKPILSLPDFIKGFEVIKRRRKPKKKLENFVVMPAEKPAEQVTAPKTLPETAVTAVPDAIPDAIPLVPRSKSKKIGKTTLKSAPMPPPSVSIPVEEVDLAEFVPAPELDDEAVIEEQQIQVVPVEKPPTTSTKTSKRKKPPPLSKDIVIREKLYLSQ